MIFLIRLLNLCFLIFLVNCSSSKSNNTVETPENETELPTDSQTEDESENETEDEKVTAHFSNVMEIIAINCGNCHSLPPANGAPMSLVSYEDILESADLIYVRINLPESDPLSMPRNKPNLTQAEIDTIKNWIDAGKPNN